MSARKDGKKKVWKTRTCGNCQESFMPTCSTQKYCGSKTKKTGCSWKMVAHRDKVRGKLPYRKAVNYVLQKEWKKKQRKENPAYAERQRSKAREYTKSERFREYARAYGKKNVKKKLENNRRRELLKRRVVGLHSQKDWEFLKKKHNYCCAECGDSEQSLHLKWGGTWKSSLTKDHIIPLSRGGSDNIDNIQPLCVSCNSSKHSKVNHKIVCVSGGMDFLHIGHVDLIEDAARFGKVVVILNSDEWLMRKKNYVFMPFAERAEILLSLRFVSAVAAVDDADDTVCEALRRIKPDYFANGGDRVTSDPREQRVCLELGIKELFGIGGGKIRSSSELLRLLLVRLPEETAKL